MKYEVESPCDQARNPAGLAGSGSGVGVGVGTGVGVCVGVGVAVKGSPSFCTSGTMMRFGPPDWLRSDAKASPELPESPSSNGLNATARPMTTTAVAIPNNQAPVREGV